MKKFRLVLVLAVACLFLGSCHTYQHSMRDVNSHLELYANDFDISETVTGEATITRILGIDWQRLFGKTEIGSAPYLGSIIPGGANYAIFNLMKNNPGYDVVMYPQVESHRHAPILGTDLYSKTTYKVTARLGKLIKK